MCHINFQQLQMFFTRSIAVLSINPPEHRTGRRRRGGRPDPQNPVRHHHPVRRIQDSPRQAVPEICQTEHGLTPCLYPAGKAGPVNDIGLQAQGQRME